MLCRLIQLFLFDFSGNNNYTRFLMPGYFSTTLYSVYQTHMRLAAILIIHAIKIKKIHSGNWRSK